MSDNWRMKTILQLREYLELIDDDYEMDLSQFPFQENNQVNSILFNPIFSTDQNTCLFERDYVSGIIFLIDTGAAFSAYPRALVPRRIKPMRNRNNNYQAANNSVIQTYGKAEMRLDFGSGRIFNWELIIADTDLPIIGADFLYEYGILVDIRNRKLIFNNEEN